MNQFVREDIVNMLVEQATSQKRRAQQPPTGPNAWFHFNASDIVLEQTPRARALRRIAMIALYRGWSMEVAKRLDRHGVKLADELSDDAIESLLEHMEKLALSADTGCDPDPDQW